MKIAALLILLLVVGISTTTAQSEPFWLIIYQDIDLEQPTEMLGQPTWHGTCVTVEGITPNGEALFKELVLEGFVSFEDADQERIAYAERYETTNGGQQYKAVIQYWFPSSEGLVLTERIEIFPPDQNLSVFSINLSNNTILVGYAQASGAGGIAYSTGIMDFAGNYTPWDPETGFTEAAWLSEESEEECPEPDWLQEHYSQWSHFKCFAANQAFMVSRVARDSVWVGQILNSVGEVILTVHKSPIAVFHIS